MACEDCPGKDFWQTADFAAVPTTQLRDFRASVRDLGWGLLGLWAAVVLVVVALLRKGLLAPGDLLPGLAGG